jgi:hypothetical protein
LTWLHVAQKNALACGDFRICHACYYKNVSQGNKLAYLLDKGNGFTQQIACIHSTIVIVIVVVIAIRGRVAFILATWGTTLLAGTWRNGLDEMLCHEM